MSQMVSLFIDTAPETVSGVRHGAPKRHPRRAEKPWRAPFARLKKDAVKAFRLEVHALYRAGKSISEIGTIVQKDRATVRHHLRRCG